MAVPVVIGTPSYASYSGGGGLTTTNITVPTNIAGDLLVVVLNGIESGANSMSGWTQFINEFYDFPADSNYTSRAWWKISSGSEPGTHAITHNAFNVFNASMLVVRGAADPTDIAIVSAVHFDETADVNNPSPSLTVTTNDSLVIRVVAERQGTVTFTPPAGHTEILDQPSGWGSLSIATIEADAGATGTATFVNSLGWPTSFVLPAFALAPAPVDATAPELVSATINSAGTTLTVVFDEAVTAANANGFTLNPSGASASLTLASGSGTATLSFTIGRAIDTVETATLSYDDATGDVTDIIGNALVDFTGESVTNNSDYVTPTGPILTATINSAGTTLTVLLEDSATITNATGWSLTFNNHASRTLTYVSGSGTDTFVFSLSAVSPSTDARAPIGATCLLTYDADTGNVSGLVDVTDEVVTNNSTQVPDPDLPQNLPTAALPANWDATADHTPADGTALQALFNDFGGTLNAGDVIELDPEVDYGHIVIPANVQGSAGNWIIVRPSTYANLPGFSLTDASGRVNAGDEVNMATLSRTPSQENHSSLNLNGGDGTVGAGYIRFIGIKFTLYGSYGTDVLAIVSTLTGGFASTIGELPHHIGFDRCSFTHAEAMKGVQDAVRLDADDSFIVGCNFYDLYGAGNDGSNATRIYNGHRLLVKNNYFNCNGASGFVGDNDLTVVEDYEFSNNYHVRNSDWGTGHGNNKGSYECKTGRRLSVINNVFHRQFNESGFGAITVKAEGTGGPKTTNHFTAIGNLMIDCGQAYVILVGGSSDDADVGPNTDLLFKNGLAYNLSRRGVQLNVYDHTTEAPMERLQIIHNTLLGGFNVDGSDAGATPGQYCVMTDNVFTGAFGIYFVNNGAFGAQGLNFTWGDTYDVQYNLWTEQDINSFDNDTSPTPLGVLDNNLFPADVAAIGFTDSDNDDYSIADDSDYAASSSTGGKPGYEADTYDSIWVGIMGLSPSPSPSPFSPSLSPSLSPSPSPSLSLSPSPFSPSPSPSLLSPSLSLSPSPSPYITIYHYEVRFNQQVSIIVNSMDGETNDDLPNSNGILRFPAGSTYVINQERLDQGQLMNLAKLGIIQFRETRTREYT